MELIEKILSEENLQKAIRKVKKNKGAPGVDKMTVQEVEEWFNQYKEDLISKIFITTIQTYARQKSLYS